MVSIKSCSTHLGQFLDSLDPGCSGSASNVNLSDGHLFGEIGMKDKRNSYVVIITDVIR